MEKLILKFSVKSLLIQALLASAAISIAACGGTNSTLDSGLDDYSQVIPGGFSQADSTALSGTGAIRFSNVIPGILSNNSLALQAQLDGAISGSYVTAVFNTDININTANGIAIKFTRNGVNVSGTVSAGGANVTMISSPISFYNPVSLDLIIEVHNTTAVGSTNKSRVVIWRQDMSIFAASTADIDTNVPSDISGTYSSTFQGTGINIGLILNQSTVTQAQVGFAKLAE